MARGLAGSARNALERLGNGGHMRATGGAHPDLIAMARCQDCLDHGPW